jgi:hypothetical protein
MSSSFPAWYYGPKDEARIFDRAEDVPSGWADAPHAVEEGPVANEPPRSKRKGAAR